MTSFKYRCYRRMRMAKPLEKWVSYPMTDGESYIADDKVTRIRIGGHPDGLAAGTVLAYDCHTRNIYGNLQQSYVNISASGSNRGVFYRSNSTAYKTNRLYRVKFSYYLSGMTNGVCPIYIGIGGNSESSNRTVPKFFLSNPYFLINPNNESSGNVNFVFETPASISSDRLFPQVAFFAAEPSSTAAVGYGFSLYTSSFMITEISNEDENPDYISGGRLEDNVYLSRDLYSCDSACDYITLRFPEMVAYVEYNTEKNPDGEVVPLQTPYSETVSIYQSSIYFEEFYFRLCGGNPPSSIEIA